MKIGILTNFLDPHPGLSLTSIVSDQITMLSKYVHDVTLFVADRYSTEHYQLEPRGSYHVRKVIPHPDLVDYSTRKDISEEHLKASEEIAKVFVQEFKDFDLIITHDFIFTGWKLPYALAIMEASRNLPTVKWLHWIHSVARHNFDWWDLSEYGPNHKIVIPNRTHKKLTAAMYATDSYNVKCIPHIKDIRVWEDFCEDSWAFLETFPSVIHADVIQCYPASTDRLEPKGLDKVIQAFGAMKKFNRSVSLIVANQWATGTQPKQNVMDYLELAYRHGLRGSEFIFTSQFDEPRFDLGIHRHFLRDLMKLSNVFFFPTTEESFGLVLPEVALSSGCLPVLNFNCAVLHEITNRRGLFFEYPANGRDVQHENGEEQFTRGVSGIVLDQMEEEESVSARTFIRQNFNLDTIYRKYYEPLLETMNYL